MRAHLGCLPGISFFVSLLAKNTASDKRDANNSVRDLNFKYCNERKNIEHLLFGEVIIQLFRLEVV